jgi:hypothetical protein
LRLEVHGHRSPMDGMIDVPTIPPGPAWLAAVALVTGLILAVVREALKRKPGANGQARELIVRQEAQQQEALMGLVARVNDGQDRLNAGQERIASTLDHVSRVMGEQTGVLGELKRTLDATQESARRAETQGRGAERAIHEIHEVHEDLMRRRRSEER